MMKKAPKNSRKSPSSKVSGQNLQPVDSKKKTSDVESKKRKMVIEENKAGAGSTKRKKLPEDIVRSVRVYQRKLKSNSSAASTTTNDQNNSVGDPSPSIAVASSGVEEDDIEEYSSTSKDGDGSDEDWTA